MNCIEQINELVDYARYITDKRMELSIAINHFGVKLHEMLSYPDSGLLLDAINPDMKSDLIDHIDDIIRNDPSLIDNRYARVREVSDSLEGIQSIIDSVTDKLKNIMNEDSD